MFKRVLATVDGSATSLAGLKAAINLAGDQQADLHILYVYEDPAIAAATVDGLYVPGAYTDQFLDDMRAAASAVIAKACALAERSGLVPKPILIESRGRTAADEIIRQAKKVKADVIVLGTHGRRGLRRIVMGSDAESVVRESPVPVLLVRNVRRRRVA